jgi:hypothetical protein
VRADGLIASIEQYTSTSGNSGSQGMTTVRLMVALPNNYANVYTIAGTEQSPMRFPGGAYQADAPFGKNVGGVSPAFFAVMPDSEFDSWLTVGITDGDTGGALSSIGLDFDSWNSGSKLEMDFHPPFTRCVQASL